MSGRSGDRTRTGISPHGILSPVRLPISPSGRDSAPHVTHRIGPSADCQSAVAGLPRIAPPLHYTDIPDSVVGLD